MLRHMLTGMVRKYPRPTVVRIMFCSSQPLTVQSPITEENTGEEPRDWEASRRHRRWLYRFYREKVWKFLV